MYVPTRLYMYYDTEMFFMMLVHFSLSIQIKRLTNEGVEALHHH